MDLTTPHSLSPPPPGHHQGIPVFPSPPLLSHHQVSQMFPPRRFPSPIQEFLSPPQLESSPPGIFAPELNFLLSEEMQRQFQLQSQLAHHQMVCYSSNNNISKNSTDAAATTTNLSNFSETLRNNLIEIFPSIIMDEEDVRFLSRENFKNHSAQAYPFVQFKFDNSNYISYYGLENVSDTEKKVEERDRLYRLLNGTKLLDERTGNQNVSWSKLDDVFKKLPVCFRKKKTTTKSTAIKINLEKHREEHADTRLGFRFDNMFAVKRFFTFGERMVNSGEIHIIQTCEVPILYNELKMEHYRNKRKISQSTNVYYEKFDGLFDPTDQQYYNTYVLNPHTIYMVPSNTIYILICTQKTLFSIDRVENSKFLKMRRENFRWNTVEIFPPTQHKQLKIELPATDKIVVVKNVKKKKFLDLEKKWVYNDTLNPPEIFKQPRQIIVEGEDNQIECTPFFYFEELNNEYYFQQNENVEIDLTSSSTALSDSNIFTPNDSFSDIDDIDYYAPLSEEQNDQFNSILIELRALDNNEDNQPTISFEDMSNIFDNNDPPPENVTRDCNKLLEDVNNFAKEYFEN